MLLKDDCGEERSKKEVESKSTIREKQQNGHNHEI